MKKKYILILVIILVLSLVSLHIYSNKNIHTFEIESRTSYVGKTKISDESDFEVMGWIKVQGTNIDYPLIRTDNSESPFPVELESFAWSTNYDNLFHNHIFIIGHNIFNLSSKPKLSDERFTRFEELMNFVYYDFAKENQYIQLTIDGKDYIYKIFSVGFLKESEVYGFPFHDDYTKKEMKDYIRVMNKFNIYQYDVDVNENDKVISLNTCTRFFGPDSKKEFYVNGRLLRDGENTSNYKVKKSKNYKIIEDMWEGEEKDEESSM